MEISVLRFSVEAGIVVRGQVKRAINSYLFTRGLEFEVKEDKGWLESMFYYTVRGDSVKLEQVKKDLTNWKL